MHVYETIHVQIDGPFAHVTLNRPEVKNAMNAQMVLDLIACFEALQEDRTLRAVVISGAGGTFCAGGDIKEMAVIAQGGEDRFTAALDRLLGLVNQSPQVVIAQVEGAALGGGLGLVCVADMAYTSTEAKMGLPEVRLGLVPALISPYVIQRVGLPRARELMLTGRRFSGAEAARYGVVTEAVEPADLTERVKSVLDELRQCSPAALAACKALIFRVHNQQVTETFDYRASLLNELRQSDDGIEGMMAFVQKRSPRWAETD
jgi:isohexenylglutaconyl-CoA hydratase